ncbi:MAG: class I SAM-dependent methyltransferase [Phycisphaerales bacterium]|nr:MAG: class I SAM-dependent methyltransferase [Phycisphaerales bacterium]
MNNFRSLVKLVCILSIMCAFSPMEVEAGGCTEKANKILDTSVVRGGLIVHIGCGNGNLTAALCVNDRYLVHGLDPDVKNVTRARKYLQSIGRYGKVMIDRLPAMSLPYVDNSVNLVVGQDLGAISNNEVMRVVVEEAYWSMGRAPPRFSNRAAGNSPQADRY